MSTSFADLGVPTTLVSSLHARGIDEPFPIQSATLPDALAGRDICGRAPTGSGKTIAFGIPLVINIGRAAPRRPRGLVLVPTRELAGQVADELKLLAAPKGPKVEAFYGGSRFDRQIKALNQGCDIVVACPGRLADLIEQGYCDLSDVELVVIDEADRMADMGFLPDVRRLLDQCGATRQTLLFSATLDGDVTVLIDRYQRNPVRHEFSSDDEGGVLADHYFWQVDRLDRLKAAAAVVKALGPTVVFCRTKRGADRIATQLDAKGVRAAAIHGDRSQSQRERALESFHRGRVEALVATDVAARGIHVDGVAGVIHYDPPADHKDYVHRSGRTARAGNTGVVVSLVAPDVRKAVAVIQKELGFAVGLDPLNLDLLTRPESTRPVTTTASSRTGSGVSTVSTVSTRPPRDSTRADRPAGPDRPVRSDRSASPDRPARSDRSARPGSSANTDRSASSDRPARAHRSAGPDRSVRPDTRAASPAPERPVAADARPPLAEGQRRPSGAARRKAKRLLAEERARLGITDEHVDLREGDSSRTSKGSEWSRDTTPRSPRPASKGVAPRQGAARRPGRAPAPKRNQGRPASRCSGPTI